MRAPTRLLPALAMGLCCVAGACSKSDGARETPAARAPESVDDGPRAPSADSAPRAPAEEARPDAPAPAASADPTTAADGAATAADAATPGEIRGIVRFAGEPPPRKELVLNAAGCEVHATPVLSESVIAKDGRLQNAFVYVDKGPKNLVVPPPPAEAVVLDQKGCVYAPHVVGIQVGQELRVRNSDKATHNVHARPVRNDAFNVSQPPGGQDVAHVFERREIMIPIACDIHPWMKSWLGVVDHPFFATSGPDGAFAIEGLPAGKYTLVAWHEVLGKQKATVTVRPGLASAVEFTFSD